MNADLHTGLSSTEAAERLQRFGPNALPPQRSRSLVRIAFDTLREPMFALMMGAAVLYLVIGDLAEGLFLVLAAVVSVSLVILQEGRSERALAALRDLAQPQSRVIRDGEARTIAARDLVPGDILLIAEGQRIPADALLVGGEVLRVDEAVLTGESAPVTKTLAEADGGFPADAEPGGEDASPLLFSGTLVTRGQGVARVARTGPQASLGKIGAALAQIEESQTPLQRAAARLVGMLGLLALAFCGLIAVLHGLLRHDWIGGALAGVTVAIAIVPEEFPMVLTVFLALGAWRLARHQVLVRRGAVIEALGAASVLCVDKTGTLTENRMRLERLWSPGVDSDLVAAAARASAVRPSDPMDRAIREAATDPPTSEPVRVWPLSPHRLAVIQAWPTGTGAYRFSAKGSPEAVLRLCERGDHDVRAVHRVLDDMTGDGLRVLGVAEALSDRLEVEPDELTFEFKGLTAFEDPLRDDVPAALAEARGAGIRVIMITGDHPATARAIARHSGIDETGEVLRGGDLANLPFPTVCERLKEVNVFARVAPEQKLLIVEALKADGEVVAMTGDGVNDAPALQAADIGIAMGRRGSDVAREAADLVLLEDRFASIVGGVRLGRRIFVNLRRALIFVTAVHVPIAGLALLPLLLGLPQVLFPLHVVLLELAIDPLCSLAFEGEPSEDEAMRRPPRPKDEGLFGTREIILAGLQGAGVLAAVLAVYIHALQSQTVEQARGAAFVALVVGNLSLALADASAGSGKLFARHRLVFWGVAAAVTGVVVAALTAPFIGGLFAIARPDAVVLSAAVAAALVSGGWYAIYGRLSSHRRAAGV